MKTNFGVSKKHYKYSNNKKIWGLGQGIGWAGARWLVTSSVIDKIMQRECSGVQFSSPDQTVSVQKLTDMFVDDLNQYCNTPSPGHTLLTQ